MKSISLAGREIAITAIKELVDRDIIVHEDGEHIIAVLQVFPLKDNDENTFMPAPENSR